MVRTVGWIHLTKTPRSEKLTFATTAVMTPAQLNCTLSALLRPTPMTIMRMQNQSNRLMGCLSMSHAHRTVLMGSPDLTVSANDGSDRWMERLVKMKPKPKKTPTRARLAPSKKPMGRRSRVRTCTRYAMRAEVPNCDRHRKKGASRRDMYSLEVMTVTTLAMYHAAIFRSTHDSDGAWADMAAPREAPRGRGGAACRARA
mmetsp:Transcript_17894/g.60839  ORF Transcript_17894/g.60839 Transcript_17894/m.60839 type:complete len:201 (+) Transcript_17894:486-1088(+)